MTCQKCEKPIKSRGLCNTHYIAFWRAQQPDRKKEKLIAVIRKRERRYIIKQIEQMPVHLIRWELINFLENK